MKTVTIWKTDFNVFPKLSAKLLSSIHQTDGTDLRIVSEKKNFFVAQGYDTVINSLYQ